MTRFFCMLLFLCASVVVAQEAVRIGSKTLLESVIVGEIATQLVRHSGTKVEHVANIGDSHEIWAALKSGDVDAYVEYTGTLEREILPADEEAVRGQTLEEMLGRYGLRMTASLGFANSYAIGMREELADALGIRAISDLKQHTNLHMAFSHEFLGRGDGWEDLKTRYNLPHNDVRRVDHQSAYRSLSIGVVDVIDVYTTDREIARDNIRVLIDDLDYFPNYNAVILYRDTMVQHNLEALRNLMRLEGRINVDEIRHMNASVRDGKMSPRKVAALYLHDRFSIELPKPNWFFDTVVPTLAWLWPYLATLMAGVLLGIAMMFVRRRK